MRSVRRLAAPAPHACPACPAPRAAPRARWPAHDPCCAATPPACVAGLDEILAGTGLSLDELIAAKRLFVQDYAPFAPRLTPSPGHVLEAPTALFFLDGADEKDPKAQLMPLAIK